MKGFGIVAVLAALGLAGCQQAPAVAAPEPTAAAPTNPQESSALGVAFDHAAGLQTRPCDGAMPRCVVLFDPAAEEFMRDLFTVQVFAGPLEAVAAAEGGFERNAEGRLMTTFGRFESVPVEAFAVNGKSGLRATITCGISDPETGFHAAGLGTRPCDGAAPRCVVLFDPAAEEFIRDLFTVQVFAGPLEAVAAAEGGFERNAEGRLMTTFGRFESVPVEAFEVNGRSGLRATITCGISDPETGFHAAGGECLWAVVGDGAQSVVISSSGFPNGLEAAEAAVRSVRSPCHRHRAAVSWASP